MQTFYLPLASPQARDISSGLEPSPIPVEGLTEEAIDDLFKVFRRYVTDSVLPDGNPLSRASIPDDDDEEDRESWTCNCAVSGNGWNCSVNDGDECDCVAQFGCFYTTPSSSDEHQTLNLDALPAKLPLVECSPRCLCATTCANRVTQSGVRVPLAVRPSTSGVGLGLFYRSLGSSSQTSLPSGTFISLYAGEMLDDTEARSRWQDNQSHPHQEGQGNYTLSLRLPSGSVHIDPRRVGNVGRFLNHSCEPNCVIHVVRWGGGPGWSRAGIFTKRAVELGEELTFDYGDASGEGKPDMESVRQDDGAVGQRTRCLCGKKKCRGWMPFDETL